MAKKHLLKIPALLLAALLLLFSALPASAAEVSSSSGRRTVKVAVLRYDQYAEQDENGVWTGYDIEMMESIAQTAGFIADFVPVNSEQDINRGLADGSIDIAGNMAKNSEREQTYLFSEYEQGSTGISIVVRRDCDTIDYGSIEQLASLSYVAVYGNTVDLFMKWCADHGFSPDLRLVSTYDEASAAVDSGAADAAVLTDDTGVNGKYRIVSSFGRIPYYYIFRKGDTELKNEVDSAEAKILRQDPLFESTLREKYGIIARASIGFTGTEKDYIAAHPTVKVAVAEDDKPYYYTDPNGAAAGILPDLYEKIAEKTGLQFVFSAYGTQQAAVDAVLAGGADVLGIYSNGITYAYTAGLQLTASYATTNLAMITRAGTDTSAVRTIAVKGRSIDMLRNSLAGDLASAGFVSYGSAAACFSAVRDGTADALIVGLPSATWLINQVNSSAYSFVPLSAAGLELCAAVPYGSGTLADILSKGISQTEGLFNGIVANNTGSEKTLQTMIARIPAAGIVIFAALTALLILLLIWAVIALTKSRRTRVAAVRAEAAAEEHRIRAEAIEKSAEEKNAFFSNISHDMRTPLNGILGFTDLAARQTSPEKTKEYLAKIRLSGNLLLGLINDTLTISKGSSGKLELKADPVSTDVITKNVTESVRQVAAQKGVDLIVDDTGLRRRTVLADQVNVEKIFLNLLSNAVKFTPEGGHVRYTVRDDPRGAADPDIVVEVRDDGIGMSAEYMKHMYEPFSQEKRHGYESVGTGLGLSIVRQLVDLMGGTITAQSDEHEGTVFTVRLHPPEAAAPAAPEQEPKLPAAGLDGKKVLLCEDNPLNREIAVALLQEKGLTVTVAENGKIGLDLFAASAPGEFSAVLMDVRMPVLDGIGAARAIRALDRPDAGTVPIIAMTADAFEEDIRQCLDAGMNDHVAKPVEPDLLFAALRNAVGG